MPNGLILPITEIVTTPRFRNSPDDKLMFAVGSPAGGNDVYGLFADDDGADLHWNYIGSVVIDGGGTPLSITALGSRTGGTVFVGTKDGRIFALSPASGTVLNLFVAPQSTIPGTVTRFTIESDSVAFAVYNTSNNGLVLQLGPLRWDVLGSGQPGVGRGLGLPTTEGGFFAMEIDRTASPNSLFLATDNNVYVSRNGGDSWQLAGMGLPKRPHCADLRFVSHANGVHLLYLSTYGRSLWRARLSPA